MQYTLITKLGKVYTFSVKECADTFQKAYGGTLFTAQDLAFESIKEQFQQPEIMAVLNRLAQR